jgi:predicted flavoprotein YhiN
MLTRYGLEGGPIYQLGSVLRAMPQPAIFIDFKPTFSEAQLITKLGQTKRNLLEAARQAWKLSPAVHAILATRPCPDAASLAHLVKHFPIALTGPRPLDEAISSAGGLCWGELSPSLMVTKFPGLFAAGEMLDWEAPTGGYLMQGCLATATRAARSAVDWLGRRSED